jgi:hypothetical protein
VITGGKSLNINGGMELYEKTHTGRISPYAGLPYGRCWPGTHYRILFTFTNSAACIHNHSWGAFGFLRALGSEERKGKVMPSPRAFTVTLTKEIPVQIKDYKVKATLEFDIRNVKTDDLSDILVVAIKDGYSVTFVSPQNNL